MTHHHSSLVVQCDVVIGTKGGTCPNHAEIKNVRQEADYLLEREAIELGWYIPFGGKTRCPQHHKEEAARWELTSLYRAAASAELPISQQPLQKAKAK